MTPFNPFFSNLEHIGQCSPRIIRRNSNERNRATEQLYRWTPTCLLRRELRLHDTGQCRVPTAATGPL